MKMKGVIKGMVLTSIAIAVQQVTMLVFAFRGIIGDPNTKSWTFDQGSVVINDEAPVSLVEYMGGQGLLLGSLVGIIILLIGGYFLFGNSLSGLAIRPFTVKSAAKWALVFVAFVGLSSWMESWTDSVQEDQMSKLFQNGSKTFGIVGVFFAAAILIPLFEELAFRGFLYTELDSAFGPQAAVAVSSVLFAIAHMQYDITLVGLVLVAGLILGMLRRSTNSILPGLLLHSLNNAAALVMALHNQ